MRRIPSLARLALPAPLGLIVGALVVLTALGPSPAAQILPPPDSLLKLDPLLQLRVSQLLGRSRVVVRAVDAASVPLVKTVIQLAGGTLGRSLPIIDGVAADIPNASLLTVAASPLIERISLDRLVAGAMQRTGATIGSAAARQEFGYDGSGVGVAVIDSGVTSWHDDLTDPAAGGIQRVDRFVDFVAGRQAPYDDYGHGTHVAGIVAGNGYDSAGARSGIAPAARLIVLKVLDGSGRGRISDVIAALDYVLTHKQTLSIRVVNMSVATGVYESYYSDPLTRAARRVSDAGVVVVAAAGNYGRDAQGQNRYGGITAPGNAPWVLTVGASSHMGTVGREDDTIAPFSSRGPTAIDRAAKPDIVAPGVGIESLSDPASAFYVTKYPYLLSGTVATAYLPYLSLSGTSMAAPVVSGTVALMLQANPGLTPNQVKAILQQTAQTYPGYGRFSQGAGFLDAGAAIRRARDCAAGYCDLDLARWNAWADLVGYFQTVAWIATWSGTGSGGTVSPTDDGENTVVWGTNGDEGTVVWGTNDAENTVVWGTSCGDPSCEPVIWND